MTDRSLLQQYQSEARNLLQAPEKCTAMWEQLKKTETGWKLTYKDAAMLFATHQESLEMLLLVNSPDELMDLLDEDQDGNLEQDEQLLLFSLIKERMQNTATELRLLHEYSLSEQLMKQARVLERNIFTYQQELRKRIYDLEQRVQWEAIERDKRMFKETWRARLEEARREAEEKIREMKKVHEGELNRLEEEANMADRTTMGIKPRESYLELQTEERLAAITEKYSEAKKTQKILSEVSAAEDRRVQSEISKTNQAKLRNLLQKHRLELECATQRAEQTMEQLKRRMEVAKLQLNKAIANKVKVLNKVHSDGYREGSKLGLMREELRRTKEQAKKIVVALNELRYSPNSLVKSESSANRSHVSLPPLKTMRSSLNTVSSLKNLIPQVPRFQLANEVLRLEAPNISNAPIGHLRGGRFKLRQLSPSPRSIAELYDSELDLRSDQLPALS